MQGRADGARGRRALGRAALVVLAASLGALLLVAGCSDGDSGGEPKTEVLAKDDRVSTVEGKEIRLDLLANDSGEGLKLKVKPGRIMGFVTCENPVKKCTYIARDFTGTEKFSYTVEDAHGRTDTATVRVEVESVVAADEVSEKLLARDDRASTVEGKPVKIEMIANDEGQDVEIGEIKPGNVKGEIVCDADVETGDLLACVYTVEGFTGTDSFSYEAKDAGGNTDEAEVVVKVEPAR
jgi:large repetitive protein